MTSTHLRERPPVAITPGAALDHAQLASIAVERTRMPMAVADPHAPDCPIVFANKAFLEQTGYGADEVIGRNCRFLQGPDTDRATVKQIRDAIADERGITVELLNYRRDATPFWNRLLLSPITDDDGRLIYYFASQQDVTAERRARDLAAREHVLLREVDHRAKNALALVQGIVRLTRADNASDYSRSVQGRVDALARAHIILSDAGWRDVPLDRVIAVATAPFDPGRTDCSGERVTVDAAHVQPLILALHEMLTNAAEHGALSASEGEVTLSWRNDRRVVTIELAERGGPAAVAPDRAGYGLTIVDAFVRRQLAGTVERSWGPDGLTTRIEFPRLAA